MTDNADIMAANRIDALLNRSFIEPLLGMGYPVGDLSLLQRLEPFVKDGDEGNLSSIWISSACRIIRGNW